MYTKHRNSTESAITVIHHDHDSYGNYTFGITSTPGQFDGCSEPGCYEDTIIYENQLDQIIALINISESCEQNIINNCTVNILSGTSWWTDRNVNRVEYWDGSHPVGTEGCKCSLEGSGCTPNQHGDSVSLAPFTITKIAVS